MRKNLVGKIYLRQEIIHWRDENNACFCGGDFCLDPDAYNEGYVFGIQNLECSAYEIRGKIYEEIVEIDHQWLKTEEEREANFDENYLEIIGKS